MTGGQVSWLVIGDLHLYLNVKENTKFSRR